MFFHLAPHYYLPVLVFYIKWFNFFVVKSYDQVWINESYLIITNVPQTDTKIPINLIISPKCLCSFLFFPIFWCNNIHNSYFIDFASLLNSQSTQRNTLCVISFWESNQIHFNSIFVIITCIIIVIVIITIAEESFLL